MPFRCVLVADITVIACWFLFSKSRSYFVCNITGGDSKKDRLHSNASTGSI